MTTKQRKTVGRGEALAKLEALGLEALCDALVNGETQIEISARLGVDKGTMSRWIAADDERRARVHEARKEAASTWDEKAEAVLKTARGKDGIARARELASHYRWRSSKADPGQYGDKLAVGGADDLPPVNHSITVQFVGSGS